jgi:uncharacterized protein (DUF362 family)/NAD-dependent dihydropyrimidine dehydrogenase PreA subunit
MSRVLIHPATYDTAREAVDRAFELFPPDLEGKRVLVKPNVLRASGAEEGIATHPAVLRAVVDKVEGMRPGELVVGDNPGLFNYGDNEESFRRTGLMEAAGNHYVNIGNDARELPFDPDYMPRVSVSSAVLDADVIISLPRFKTHGLTVVTGAVKNSYGILPGAQKAKLHRAAGNAERFHDVVVKVFQLRVPDLFIMDAVVGMEGNGPASPDLRDVGKIMASDDAVAMDAVMAYMMGCDPGKLRFLRRAREEGLGEYDLERIEVIGELAVIPGYKLPPLGGEAILGNEDIQAVIQGKTVLAPEADPELCTGCCTCVDQCPVSALSMTEQEIPRVDEETCIGCFCCQEICPEKAITLQ